MKKNKETRKGRQLLTLTDTGDTCWLEADDPARAAELLYEVLRAGLTQSSVCVMIAVERLRAESPEMYQQYFDHICRALALADAERNNN